MLRQLRPPSTLTYRKRPTTERIILHDSHTYAGMDQGVQWLRVNGRTRGYLSIGYNFVIERSGETVECRPFDCVGSHTPGHNHRSIGVCLIGGRAPHVFDGTQREPAPIPEDNFTANQTIALRKLVTNIWRLYPGIPLVGHSEVQRFHDGSRCPCIDMREVRAGLSQHHREEP